MDARHVAHWVTLATVVLFAVTGIEVRMAEPVANVAVVTATAS